jgi:hypothetical protein
MSRMAAHGCSCCLRPWNVDDQAVAPEPARRAKHQLHTQGGMTAFHLSRDVFYERSRVVRENIYRNYRQL